MTHVFNAQCCFIEAITKIKFTIPKGKWFGTFIGQRF